MEEIRKELGDITQEVHRAISDGVKNVALMTHAKTIELAGERLGSTRQKYVDALGFEEIAPNVWAVSLDESMLWLEEGKEPGSMVDDLLGENPKIAKDGAKYRVIPFEHTAPRQSLTPQARSTVDIIKKELKSRGLPFRKLEVDSKGSPRLGKLYTINIKSQLPTPSANTPALHGLTVYQRKGPEGKVRREILTFRTVHEKHKSEGKWHHPGIQGKKLMDEALEWAQDVFDREILPEILKDYK